MIYTRGYDRLVNLSDAVIAIAATLLILPLVEATSTIGKQDPATFLSENWQQLFLFVLSFAVIARFWLTHHQLYRDITGYTLGLIWLNFLWLLSIVFLPFPTELLGQVNNGATDRVTVALYIGTMLVTAASGTAQQYIIVKTPALQIESKRGTLHYGSSMLSTISMAAAFVIGVGVPGVGLWSLLILFISGWAEAIWERRHRARVARG